MADLRFPMTAAQRTELICQAIAARGTAYAPYSKFTVGAALLTESGEIVIGANVENASYGLTMCAERVAIGAAVAAGHRLFQALAIATAGQAAPCGACRQVVAEFAPDLLILLVDAEQPQLAIETHLAELLPCQFRCP